MSYQERERARARRRRRANILAITYGVFVGTGFAIGVAKLLSLAWG